MSEVFSVQCPACGSNKVVRYEKNNFGQLTLGKDFPFKEIYYICNSCKEEGDFLAETDKNYTIAEKDAQIKLVKKILENINDVGITMAMFERAFELPIRTLTRWKNGDFSASALALLRIVATYPWIIEVAEHAFERSYASSEVIKVAASEFQKNTATLRTNQSGDIQIPVFSNKKVKR